jgi:hypothetical protein
VLDGDERPIRRIALEPAEGVPAMPAGSGQCLCGAVRFTASDVETRHHVCHCGMCRRWSGGPAFAAVAQGVAFEGEENIARYRSSDWAERCFCKKCGTSLFYFFVPDALYFMSVGIFDTPGDFSVAGEIFIDHKPAGYDLAGDHPRKTEAEHLAEIAAAGGG